MKKKKAWIIFPLIKFHVYQLIHPRILQRIRFLDVRSVNRWSYHIRHWKDRTHYRTMKSWSLSRSLGSNFWNEEASFTPTFDPFLSEFLWIPLASWQWLKFHSFQIVRAVSRIPPPLRAPFPAPRPVICAYRPRRHPLFRASLSFSLSLSASVQDG